MSTDRQRDADLDRLLRATLRRETAQAPHACPDAGMLAALVEGGAAGDERAALEAHVASCGRCQDTLAALDIDAPPSPVAAPAAAEHRPWLWRGHLHWLIPAAAATALVVYVASWPAIAPGGPKVGREENQVAELRPTAPPAAALQTKPAAVPEPAAETRKSARPRSAAETTPMAAKDERAVLDVDTSKRAADRPAAAPQDMNPASAPAPAPPPAPVAVAAPETVAAQSAAAAGMAPDTTAKRVKAAEVPAAAPAKNVLAEPALHTAAADLVVVSAPGGAIQWRVGPEGTIWRSGDEGRSWYPQRSGVKAALLAAAAPSATTCWAVGAGGTVLLTDDGERWERRPFPDKTDLVAVDARSAHEAAVTTRDGRRFATADRGATWTLQR